jgi:hypothetical protein
MKSRLLTLWRHRYGILRPGRDRSISSCARNRDEQGRPFPDLTTMKRHLPPAVNRAEADLLSAGDPPILLMTIRWSSPRVVRCE